MVARLRGAVGGLPMIVVAGLDCGESPASLTVTILYPYVSPAVTAVSVYVVPVPDGCASSVYAPPLVFLYIL
mgnify:CR=1 FL=1